MSKTLKIFLIIFALLLCIFIFMPSVVMAGKTPAIKGTSVYRESATNAKVNYISGINGTVYYMITNSDEVPTASDIKTNGINGGNITANTTESIILTGLTSGAKYVYIVLEDVSNEFSNILTISMPNDLYYFDDFEAYNIDVYPKFFTIKHNGGNASLQKIINLNNNKAFNGYGTYAKGLDERIQINALSTGYAVLEADISASSLPDLWYFGGIVIGSNYNSDDRNIVVQAYSTNKLFSASGHTSSITFEVNTNYHVKIVVDVENNRYDYYINGIKANNTPVNVSPFTELTWFGIYNGNGTVYYDNIKFYSQATNPNKHLITKGLETNGNTFTIDKTSAEKNTTVTITPTSAEGYRVKLVKINDSVEGITQSGTSYLFTMPDENVVVTVEFEKIPYTITVNAAIGATITPNGTINVKHGDNQDITITANTGYRLTSVKVNDIEKISTLIEGVLSLTDIQEHKNITVAVERVIKTITIREMQNGTITSDKETASPGEKVTLTVTPNKGYKLKEIKILDMYDEMLVTLNEDNTFTMPNYNIVITAEFELIYSEKIITKTEGSSTVSIKGIFSGNPELVITKTENGNEGYNSLITLVKEDKEVIGSYDVSVIGGDYEGELELTFTVGKQYEGDVVTIYHKKANGEVETKTATVKDGKVVIKVDELSPFMLVIDKEVVAKKDTTPKTGTYYFTGIAILIIGLSVLGITKIKKRKEE